MRLTSGDSTEEHHLRPNVRYNGSLELLETKRIIEWIWVC